MTGPVDVVIETQVGDIYQFPNLPIGVLRSAIAKATTDGVALALVNGDSAALVVPWSLVGIVRAAPVTEDPSEDDWEVIWRSADATT